MAKKGVTVSTVDPVTKIDKKTGWWVGSQGLNRPNEYIPASPKGKKPGGPRKKNYLNKEDLLREIELSKVKQRANPRLRPSECLTPTLVLMLMTLVSRVGTRGNFCNYSYVEDMKSEALVSLCQNALKFDAEKSQNPFGYYTQITMHSFLTYMEKERKLRDCRDKLRQSMDLAGSYSSQIDNEMEFRDDIGPGEVIMISPDDYEAPEPEA